MKINIESFTNPITEDILQRKDFQYPSGNINVDVKIPDDIKNYIIEIFNNTDDIKENQNQLREIILSELNNITQLLARANMYLESINNFLRN
jgi:hypothetical protein